MATPISGKPASTTRSAPSAGSAAPSATGGSTGGATAESVAQDSTSFPPLYEAAILYAAEHNDAAQETLKEYLKTNDGKNSIRAWLMMFDFYQITNNRKEFDSLSMLFTVKFERSPPVWTDTHDVGDPRRREKRERKDFFQMTPDGDGALLGEIDRFESFAKELGSVRLDFAKIKVILSEEAELFAIVCQRLRRAKLPVWFNGFDEFAVLLRKSINDAAGLPLKASQGYWSLLFEMYILDGKLNEYEELGLEYAVAFEVSPPAWVVVSRPSAADDDDASAKGNVTQKIAVGFPLAGVVSVGSKDVLQQLQIYAASKQEVVIDTTDLLRLDFSAVTMFFEAVRAIHMSQKRVILSNLNELVASLLEVFGLGKHAILMRKKTA
jgi:ABC-type transporter Mla MlaB component